MCVCPHYSKVKRICGVYVIYSLSRLCGGLEHLKIETRLIDERFASVMGECEIVTLKV